MRLRAQLQDTDAIKGIAIASASAELETLLTARCRAISRDIARYRVMVRDVIKDSAFRASRRMRNRCVEEPCDVARYRATSRDIARYRMYRAILRDAT